MTDHCKLDCDRFDGIHGNWYPSPTMSQWPSCGGRTGHPAKQDPCVWFAPDNVSGSDYGGTLYTKSNHRVLLRMCEAAAQRADVCKDEWYSDVTGGHNAFFLLLHCERTPDDIVEALEALENYPILDDQVLQKLETEGEQESWDNWVSSDYLKTLEELFGERYDFDNVADNDLYDHFSRHMEATNENWETEGMDRIIRGASMKRIAQDAFDGGDLPEGVVNMEPKVGVKFDLDGLRGDEAWLTQGYYTLIIPPCVRHTQWHAPDRTLSRGVFRTEALAHRWALENIPDCPYEVRYTRSAVAPKAGVPFDLDGVQPSRQTALSRAGRSGTLPTWARPRRSR